MDWRGSWGRGAGWTLRAACGALLVLSVGSGCDKKTPQAPATAAPAAATAEGAPAAAPAEGTPAAAPAEGALAAAPAEGTPAAAEGAPAAAPAEAAAAPAEGAPAATDTPTEPPKPAVPVEACQAACDNALKITLVELKDVKPAMRTSIEKKLKEDCPAQCGKSGTPESVACITKATSAAELAACPK